MAPAELEALLLTHADIDDVGVVGVADESAGELPHAWVVKRSGAELTTHQVIAFVEGKLRGLPSLGPTISCH